MKIKKSSINSAETTGHPHAKKYRSSLLTEFSSKWMRDIKVKCKTAKILKDNIGENLGDFGVGINFFICNTHDATQPMKGKKKKRKQRDLIQILKILLYKRYCQKNKKKITD